MVEVKWITPLKIRWFVSRHGSYFVYCEVKGVVKGDKPIVMRSLKVVKKGGIVEGIYSEKYTVDEYMTILESEQILIDNIKRAYETKDEALNKARRIASKIATLAKQIEFLLSEGESNG